MKSILRLSTLALFVAALTCHAVAAPKTADEVLEFTAQKMAACKAWSADYRQSMEMMGAKMNMNGTLQFKQPGLMRMGLDMLMMGMTNHMLMVQGGDKVMWQEMNMMGQKQIMKMDMTKIPTNSPMASNTMAASNPQEQVKRFREIYDYTLAGEDSVNGQPVFILEGVLKKDAKFGSDKQAEAMKAMGKTRVCIGKNDGFTYKWEQFDKDNKNIVMSMEFTNIKLNPELADDLFKYTPAEGAKVVDMTEMMTKMATPAKEESTQ